MHGFRDRPETIEAIFHNFGGVNKISPAIVADGDIGHG